DLNEAEKGGLKGRALTWTQRDVEDMHGHFFVETAGKICYSILKAGAARIQVAVHDLSAIALFGLTQDVAFGKFTVHQQPSFADAIPEERNTRPKGPAVEANSKHIFGRRCVRSSQFA